jgi:hypothetical protein
VRGPLNVARGHAGAPDLLQAPSGAVYPERESVVGRDVRERKDFSRREQLHRDALVQHEAAGLRPCRVGEVVVPVVFLAVDTAKVEIEAEELGAILGLEFKLLAQFAPECRRGLLAG